MGRSSCLLLVLFAACAGTTGRWATRAWDGGSERVPIVDVENADSAFEVVVTERHRGIQVPKVQQGLNAYGRLNLTVWVRNTGRAQEMVELKAKFFDATGGPLDAVADWAQVFVGPGDAAQVELLCAEDGAATFKVLIR